MRSPIRGSAERWVPACLCEAVSRHVTKLSVPDVRPSRIGSSASRDLGDSLNRPRTFRQKGRIVPLTRTESSQENLVVYSAPDATYRAVRSAFEVVGKVKTANDRFRRVVGRIFSGTGRMNPATVTASVQPLGDAECRVEIHANAQEGLIKQHPLRVLLADSSNSWPWTLPC